MDTIVIILKAQVREPILQTLQEYLYLRVPSINTLNRSFSLIKKRTVSKVPQIRLNQRIIRVLKEVKEVKTACRIIMERRTKISWPTHSIT